MAAAAAAQSKSMASMAKRFCSKTCNICVGTGKGQGGMAKTCKGDRSKKCKTSSKVTAHSCARLGEENVHKEAATGPGDGGGGGGDSVPVPFDFAAALIVMHQAVCSHSCWACAH